MKQMTEIKRTDRKNGSSSSMRERTPLAEAVRNFGAERRISFHVPGHKGPGGSKAESLSRFFGMDTLYRDLTELPGLDDLHDPSGVIAEAERQAAAFAGADRTFFLTNGTSSGITAAVAAASSKEDTVILERHSHECTTRGLILSGARACYVYNHFDRETGLPAGISPEDVKEAIRRSSSPSVLVLTHPSYYGTFSDLRAIVETAHQAGLAVIVDEAHGAQLMFTAQEEIPSALQAGADLVVQSTHKMLGSLTQSAMLHVQGSRIDPDRLSFYIRFMHSTSPSYLLMSSLDLVRAWMQEEGQQIWNEVTGMVRQTRERLNAIRGIHCPGFFRDCDGTEHGLEQSRLLISAWDCGLTGMELSAELASRYGIDCEFADLRYAVALAGAGSFQQDFDTLVQAVGEIARQPFRSVSPVFQKQLQRYEGVFDLRPERGMTSREAVCARTLRLTGLHAEGLVSARDISLYPPGIPVIRAGEVFSREIIEYIEEGAACGMEFHGIAGVEEEGNIWFFCAQDEFEMRLLNGIF